MAAALVGGSALGAALGEILKGALQVKDDAVKFTSNLDNVTTTLQSIKPAIDDIEKSNRGLACSDEDTKVFTDLTNLLHKGEELVIKCSKIKSWNYCKRYLYAKKLIKFHNSLKSFFQINVQAQLLSDSRRSLANQNSSNRRASFGSCEVPGVSDFIVGFDVPLKELKMELQRDGISVVVLSAPGGCGKTTLAKMLCHNEEVKGIYKDIFFVNVSKTPNLKVIIQTIYRHKDHPVPEFQSDEGAIDQLEHFLKQIAQHPVLLVLDDVWSGSESLIQNFMFAISRYKILVTSRFVFPRFDSTYKLKLLNDKEAMALFRHSAFRQDGRSSSFVPDDDLVNEIVRGCRGFPLALKVVGRSLCGQPAVIWKTTLKRWSEGLSIFSSSNNDLLDCLQTSLNALDERVKECYLDLGSFPEDEKIPVAALMDMWVELYNLDEDGMDALTILHDLSDRNLVNLVFTRNDARDVDVCNNEDFVVQHDLLRDLAIHQSREGPIEQRKRLIIDIRENYLPTQPIHARLLSISTDETFCSSWKNVQLPAVEVLILKYFRANNYSFPEFMEKMDQLKVLIIINYYFRPAELRNFPLLGSLSSLRRIRLEHVSISTLSECTLQLRNLLKISLIMCEIGEAFRNCSTQIPQMLPNVVEIDIDCCNDLVELPPGLCDAVHLKKLSITNCHELGALPEGLGKLANLEVLRLHDCTHLSELPESIGSLHKLSFLDISNCISMSKLPKRMGELCGLRKLDMRGCHGLRELPPSVKDLGQLKDVICDEERAYLWKPYQIHLPNLKINVRREDNNLNWLPKLHF
ncbi:hypothetical protein F0562_006526 [Nyssa sinensis]|uniref:RPW8 domain-containing protein n=1 Tax=Nyssa sinensis TaxID=561372 RepID=A0A5J5AQW3_9ASTE|nr:hypothetical protein F0562_006526 [Nyssa sinensis]